MMMSYYRITSKLSMGMIQNHRYKPSNTNRYSIADQNPTTRLLQSKQYNHTSSSSNSPTAAGNNVNPTTITSSSSSSSAFFAMTSALKYKYTSFIKCSYIGNPNRAAGPKKGWFGKLVKWFLISSGVSMAYVYHQNLETVPYTKRTRFILFPTLVDQVLGEELFKRDKESCEIVPENENECVRLRLILKNIIDTLHREVTNKETDDGHFGAQATTNHLDELHWEILLVSNRTYCPVYCFSAGKIVVDTSVLQHFKKDDEIATLIAHEVGHVVARHTAENFTKEMWHFIVESISQFPIVFFSSWVLMPYVVNKISYILQELPRYLQRHEMEADYIGLMLMALAGYDPRIAPKVYKNLGCLSGNYSYKPSSYSLRTHPCGEGRALLLSQAMDKPLAMYRKKKLGSNRRNV